MDDDDRFVARRGTQGDWHWQGQAPSEPEPDRPPLLARWFTAVSERLRATGAWLRAPFLSPRRSQRTFPPDADAESVQDEMPNGWAPLQTSEPELPAASPSTANTSEESAKLPPRRVPLLERLRANPPRVAILWPRFAPPRPRLNVPRPKINFRTPGTPRFPAMPIRDDLVAPLAVIAGLVLASVVAVGAIVAVQALDTGDDNSTHVGAVTDTPKPTDTLTPSGSETPLPSDAPSTETPAPDTDTPAPTAATSAATLAPTSAPAPGGLVTTPQGAVSVAYWANRLNAWWFGDLTDSVANYEEGQDIPFIVRWDGVAGQTYTLHIVSDCQTPDTFGAIDYLSGVQDWGADLQTAIYGPGSGQPDGAIPVPDTPNFDPDDGNATIFTLHGAKFPVLPQPPHPDDNCDLQRTQDLSVQAYGGTIIFLASAHLGTATVYSSGEGAKTASVPFGLHISVDGVGGAEVMVDPSAVADVER